MIDKTIHYCWFGKQPLSDEVQQCIESWKRYVPDYEIILWNEDNYDVHKIPYTSQAYNAEKYAFVSDYARLDIVYHHGGIYLDTDVELIKSLDDLLSNTCFLGCELVGRVATGLGFGTVKNHWFVKENMKRYENMDFLLPNNSYNMTTCVSITTQLLHDYGLIKTNEIQQIQDITIYPQEYFCPFDISTNTLTITDNTYSIHHYESSWYSDNKYAKKMMKFSMKYKIKLRIFVDKVFGDGVYDRIKKYLNFQSVG